MEITKKQDYALRANPAYALPKPDRQKKVSPILMIPLTEWRS